MNRYDWLKEEIKQVPRKKFHILEPCCLNDIRDIESNYGLLPFGYREFLEECGKAKLFRSNQGRWYNLSVNVPYIANSRLEEAKDNAVEKIVRLHFGHYINTGDAWFEWRDGAFLHNGDVCFGRKSKRRASFDVWLKSSFSASRKLYNKQEWNEIMQPVSSFDERELQILAAMQKFTFRKVGVTASGNVQIEVNNGSDLELPYFTIGVRAINGMEGAVALRTVGIMPGMSKVMERDLSKGSMDPNTLELFRLPLPDPEDRPYFFELRKQADLSQ